MFRKELQFAPDLIDNLWMYTILDTEKMRSNCKAFAEELARHVFHPLRVKRLAKQCGLDMDEYLELF